MTVQEDYDWSRALFDKLKEDGGYWLVPRSGLIFRRRGERLVLVHKMPYSEELPIESEGLDEIQQADFEVIKDRFGGAGIRVERAVVS